MSLGNSIAERWGESPNPRGSQGEEPCETQTGGKPEVPQRKVGKWRTENGETDYYTYTISL